MFLMFTQIEEEQSLLYLRQWIDLFVCMTNRIWEVAVTSLNIFVRP